jgi:hypothetical protein
MFAFSKHNVYLKESLEFAQTHSDKYDVQIELIQFGNPTPMTAMTPFHSIVSLILGSQI